MVSPQNSGERNFVRSQEDFLIGRNREALDDEEDGWMDGWMDATLMSPFPP